jgi:hypothetical protein
MGLSRLDNFLKSVRGTILYVDPSSIDSTDSIENTGSSLTRPFKTIQRALIESARYSYQRGSGNDRFNKTTILLYPGDHIVDNRPGWIPTGSGTFSLRSGSNGLTNLGNWDIDSNLDLSTPDNELYKINSIHGGVIIPRGTSIVGMDLRKTKIRPLYVPNPENNEIERSAIFRVTGGCYLWQFTILDADPNGVCYKDYNPNLFVPNFSHHKLSVFEYADGINPVEINDDFLSYSTSRTDLDMYYEKIAKVYGASSGREIQPDYGDGVVDIEPVVDEYRIVGSKGSSVGISSIRAGNGSVSSKTITVSLNSPLEGLSVDTPIKIEGVSFAGYDGQYVVSGVNSSTEITYIVQNPPLDPAGWTGVSGATIELVVDTVTSSSPYIFNCSLRSVYGMCGLLADGNKCTGFKSMVVAQYTGIGMQKDEKAFVLYDQTSGEYKNSIEVNNLNTNSSAKFKPEYENFHIKATNNAFLQLVSVFAIGYAQHFVAENGGDVGINNSNSNFGSKSLVSIGFKDQAFSRDDFGYITHIVPPKEIENKDITIEFSAIDVGLTTERSAGSATTSRLYLYEETNPDLPPSVIIDGYRVGAKENELLYSQIYSSGVTTEYSSRIVMPDGSYNSTQSSSEKSFRVTQSSVGINSITDNVITLDSNHSFINGESIRIISENGHLPDGLESNRVYFAITKNVATSIGTNQIKIASTLSDAIENSAVNINNKGGVLTVISRVSDKSAGDIGHPVQWDGISNWYVNVSSTLQENTFYTAIRNLGIGGLGSATQRTYIVRKPDTRSLNDTIYHARYVIPKNSLNNEKYRPPLVGFILQESNNIIGSGTTEISKLYSTSGELLNENELRNPRFIANASWNSNIATITTEIPHKLTVGSEIEIVNVIPDGYNGIYTITSINSSKSFSYQLTQNPGTFSNNTSVRTGDLPYFRRKRYNNTYQVYRTREIQKYISNVQDGIYHLVLVNFSNSPTVTPFNSLKFSQPIDKLYPQLNRDNPVSDPESAKSFAIPSLIGQVVINDSQNSITKETIEKLNVGLGITNIVSSSGIAHTIFTEIDHGFAGITSVTIVSGGLNYGSIAAASGEAYNAQLVGLAGSTTGSNATAKITYDTNGTINSIRIIDGGSSYGIGNTLAVVGVATTSSHVPAIVRVTHITQNIDDTIKISGISSSANQEYNTDYKIINVSVGKPKEISVQSLRVISGFSTSGLGVDVTADSNITLTGKAIGISTLTYDSVTGLSTVGFTTSHGFTVGNKLSISGASVTEFNGDFIVKKINGINSLIVNIGLTTTSTGTGGSLTAYRSSLTSYGGDIGVDKDISSGRLIYEYAGISTVLGSSILATDSGVLNIPNASTLGFSFGDYIAINDEIFRIKSQVTSNSVSVFRALFGSSRQTHNLHSVVRKIKVYPVELRRNSIIRASGHTFEYLGFGPGNYSTSLPEKQDRVLSNQEELLAQATKVDGGLTVYTGMNSDGDFFAGNKKINSSTGQEESYDTPIPTITGEEIESAESSTDIITNQQATINRSIKVEGGPEKNIISEFNGPVVFNEKVTTNSDLETNSIFIQGEEKISRKISVSQQKPTVAGNYGDINFNSEPKDEDFVGWTYVTENEWIPFGFIGGNGVGISSNGTYIGFSTHVNIVTSGINLSASRNPTTKTTTVTFDALPRVAISTGPDNAIAGIVTQINFVGGGVTVTASNAVSGIATITISSTGGVGAGGSNPGLPYNSLQWNNNDSFNGADITYYDPTNQRLVIGDINSYLFGDAQSAITFTNNGYVGFGSNIPTSKIEIVSDNERSLYIKSSQGTEIVRIENINNDSTPFIIDENGSVGINTGSTLAPLDVVGNAAITGAVRIYETDRSNYVGFSATSLSSNLDFTLPNSYGTNRQVLSTNGSGTLDWRQVSNQEVVAGTGITISYASVGSGLTIATISNTGITSLVAGDNIQITINNGVGIITATAGGSGGSTNLYPFTTRGFSIPI